MASSSRTCISHPTHLKHELALKGAGKFMCNGCHEYGAGKRYRCQTCGYNLHDKCALEEGTKIVHPLLKNIELELWFQAPAGLEGSKLVCNACGDDVMGFHYHSSKLCLHPCCCEKPPDDKVRMKKDAPRGNLGWHMLYVSGMVVHVIMAALTGDFTEVINKFTE
ncbi:hypothetical protein ACQJBY_039813 [Aegilops geniculata]